MGKYTQTFALHYEADPNRVWAALQQAIENMDGAKLGAVNDAARELELETGVTSTSWGEFLQAAVKPGADAGLGDRGARPAGAQVQVRGKPKGTFLTTKWGEAVHANSIKRRLNKGIRAELG